MNQMEYTYENISEAINIMSRYTFWESHCLVKAIAAMKMLERRQIESTLYLGTAKDETWKYDCTCMAAQWSFLYNWCRSDGAIYVVSKFAKKIRLK